MSFGPSASDVQQPNLVTVPLTSVPSGGGTTRIGASELWSQYANQFYQSSDANYATGFTAPLPGAATSMVDQLSAEAGGGIPQQATGALATAGLGAEGARIPGANEFQTARNLGEPILAKEQRDRNYAFNLLNGSTPYFNQRQLSLPPDAVTQIMAANTGNVNAFRLAINASQQNASASQALQNSQDIGALANLFSGGAKVAANYYQSPYANAFANIYALPGGYNSSYYSGPNSDVFGFNNAAASGSIASGY